MNELPHNDLHSHTDELPMRDRLLNAAEQVAARDGVNKLTLEAVAKEAGVSKGGLLYHFPSKSDLITAIVERLAARCEADQRQALQHEGEGAGAFSRAYLMARVKKPAPQEQPVHAALLAAVGTDSEYLAPFRKRFVDWQTLLNNDGIDPAIANIVRLAIDGLCLCRMLNIPTPNGNMEQRVIDTLINMTRTDTNKPATNEEIDK